MNPHTQKFGFGKDYKQHLLKFQYLFSEQDKQKENL